MTSILTRSSAVALKRETTEGTPVLPTAATDYIAIQDDFKMSPSFDVLENAELKSSIGKSEPILGAESPTASFSHYLRSSGVAGQEANFGILLETLLGAKSIASTEYPTVASSTTSVIKVNTGIGANFERGQALLIKDPVNGYRIRAIESVSGDNLTIGFQVPVAPGTGINLGKAVLYKPANSSHPTLTVWHYLGNGGATQMLSGGRVTDGSFDISAGDLINASYSIDGIAFYFDPVNILAADTKLDFTDDTGTFAATITAKVYKYPQELASAIQSAMAAANPLQTPTVIYSSTTGKFTIKTTGTVLSLLWNTGTNAANTVGDKIGFSTAADSTGTGATTGYTGVNPLSFVAPQVPTFDNASPLAAKDNEAMIGDVTDYLCFNASSVKLDISDSKADIKSVCAVSGKSGSIISGREVKLTVSALLDKFDADKFKRFAEGQNTKFQYSFGSKSGGNWIPGFCGCIFMPTAKISSFEISDSDGLAQLDLELTGYVNSNGEGEVYINTL